MNKTTKILVISGVVILGIAAFAWFWFKSHTSDVHLNYVPKEAAAVFSIHTREIAAKIDPAKIEELKPVSEEVNNIPDFITNIITDPISTGIDPIQNFYAFVEKEKTSTVSALVVAVEDEGDFTSFAEKMFPGRQAEDLGSFSYLDIDDTRGLAWNSEAAVFVAVKDADVRAYTEKLFAQSKDESIKTDTAFTNFNAKSFDAGLWTNNARLSTLNSETSTLSLVGMSEGNTQFFIRFEQNEIVTEYIPAKQTGTSIFQAIGPKAEDLTMLGTKDPLIFLSLNFDVEQLLASGGNDPAMKQNIDMLTASLGMTNDELTKLFTGSMVASVSDYKNIYETDPRVQKELTDLLGPVPASDMLSDVLSSAMSIEVPVTSISLGITDEKKANDMLLNTGMKEQPGGFWAAPGVEMVIYAVVKSNHLVITNDYVTAESIATKGSLPGKLPQDYAEKVPSQSFAMWMDFEKSHLPPLLLAPENPILGQEDIASYVAISGILNSIRYESTATGSKFRFILPEGEENSLMRVIRYLDRGK